MEDLIDFDRADEFEFPKQLCDFGEFTCFPFLDDCDGNDTPHPILEVLKNGGTIDSVKVGESWIDDHQTCFDLEVVVNGKLYGFSMWWMSREGFKMAVRAEQDGPDRIELREYILSHAE